MDNELTISGKNMITLATGTDLSTLLRPLSREIPLFDSYVAGTGYINDPSILDALKVGDTLTLRREPENRFDENAILVLDGKEQKIGYIPERDNTVFARLMDARLMDAGKFLTARIVRLEEKGSFRQINISIFLVDF